MMYFLLINIPVTLFLTLFLCDSKSAFRDWLVSGISIYLFSMTVLISCSCNDQFSLHLVFWPKNTEPGRLLTRFLAATQEAFERSLPPVPKLIAAETNCAQSRDSDQTALFSATQLAESCSGLIILALGRLTGSDAGESRLEQSELCATFHRILLPTAADVRAGRKANLVEGNGENLSRHCKMLLSSLDFTRPGRLGHQLLTAAVNGATKV